MSICDSRGHIVLKLTCRCAISPKLTYGIHCRNICMKCNYNMVVVYFPRLPQIHPCQPAFLHWPQPPTHLSMKYLLYPGPTKLEGGGGILDSPCPSVRPSVCRRHGFRSISQVCLGISISNFICMLMVAIGRSLLVFSDVAFKIAAWRPY